MFIYLPLKRYTKYPQVERTLVLWADGEMKPLDVEPLAAKRQSSKPTIKATSKLNPQTGILSNFRSKFSAENWGATTRNYLKSIEKMKAGSLDNIVELAMPFMSPLKSRRQESSHGPYGLAGDEDIRACLVDDEWHVFLVHSCLNTLITMFFSSDNALSLPRGG
jgi:hypothetical protein